MFVCSACEQPHEDSRCYTKVSFNYNKRKKEFGLCNEEPLYLLTLMHYMVDNFTTEHLKAYKQVEIQKKKKRGYETVTQFADLSEIVEFITYQNMDMIQTKFAEKELTDYIPKIQRLITEIEK